MSATVLSTAQSTSVIDQLRDMIVKEGLRPGDRLPAERVLAEQLGVGRPTLREAVKALAMLEVVESRRGDGTYVKSLNGLGSAWPDATSLSVSRAALIELFEVRKMIEPRAASLAAARATDAQLAAMEQHLVAQERKTSRVNESADYLFHDTIMRAAGNDILCRVIDDLAPLLRESRTVTARTTPDIPAVAKQHRRIFEAIRQGDSELAAFAMREHLNAMSLDLIAERKR